MARRYVFPENATTPQTLTLNIYGKKLFVIAIYASMPLDQQSKVFSTTPKNTRKVILSTNISETSITIPRIKYVIDTGVAKFRSYDQRTGLETLAIRPISKNSSRQRAGRAGRDVRTNQEFSAFNYLSTFNSIKRTPDPATGSTRMRSLKSYRTLPNQKFSGPTLVALYFL